MNRLFLTTFFLLLALAPFHAKADSVTLRYINLHGGVGYGLYRDLGASPLTYRGIELHPGISFQWQNPLWRCEALFLAEGGGYGLKARISYIQAYGGHPVLAFKALRLLNADTRWHLWVGGSADDLFDTRYNRSLGNASFAFGNFLRLNLDARVEYQLRNWLFHGDLQVNALSLNMRPGFAYMDNFDQEISDPAANTFDQYHWYLAAATGLATDLGATLLLTNGNRIGISYHWTYLNSRATADAITAPHTFEYAHHALLFTFGFKL